MKIKRIKKIRLLALFSTLLATGAILFIGPAHAHAALKIEPIYSVLGDTTQGTGAQVKAIWKQLIDIVNYFIIAILIFVAIAQILRINVSTYGIKKILPALILAIIGANFSFLFCRLLVDLANIVMSLFINGPQDDNLYTIFRGIGWAEPDHFGLKTASIGMLLWFMIAQLFVIAGGVITLLLAYLFFIRIWLIYFLVALAPLAFMATVLPQTKSVFTQWMSNFAKWVFLPVVSIFWIWLGNQWIENVKEDYMMSFVFAGVCYYLAITTPFKMGGAVMTAWGNLGRKLTGKPAGWAWGKAKSKWVDPLIQDYKNRAMIWYFNQASGSQSKYSTLNPIGAIARRGLRTKEFRERRAGTVATKEEGALRWALGGKPISQTYDPETGKIISKYKFWNDKGRERYAQVADDEKSDAGEADYIRKQLDMDWKANTERGKLAVGRMIAYGQRTTGVDNHLKSMELDAEGMAYGEEENDENGKPKNWFLSNTSFGVVAGDRHWKRQKDFSVGSQQRLERSAELINTKIKNDRIKFDYQPSATLTILKEELNDMEREIAKVEKQTGTKIGRGTQLSKDYTAAKNRWKKAIKKIKSEESLYVDGKFTSNAITLRSMLTDAEGNFIGDDHTKAQSLVKLWGYEGAPDDLRKLFISRLRKATSIIAKEEVTAEQSKRIPVESARRAIEKFSTEIKEMFSGMPQGVWLNTHKDAFAALKNSLVNARDENAPEIYGMYVDLLKEISTATDPEVSDEMKQNAIDILASGQKQSMKTALQQKEIMDEILNTAAMEELKMTKKTWGDLGANGRSAELAKLRKTETFRGNVSEKFINKANEISRQDIEELKQVIKIKYDERGQIHVFVDTSDTELSAKLLAGMNGQAVNFNEREKGNAEGSQRLSTIAGLTAAMPTSEEAITNFVGNVTAEGRKKKRDFKEREQAKFDAIT